MNETLLTSGDFTESPEPYELFAAWLEDATASEPNDPNAVALATVDADGLPDVRMVLLKGDVRPRELAAIPPGDRVAFLHGRCSNATREAHKEREAMLANIDFDLALDGATDGEQADA